eukprot:1161015-Pelagomonas_calceolata.AAC.5
MPSKFDTHHPRENGLSLGIQHYSLFGAHRNSLSSRFLGISICHTIYDEKAMTLALQHALYFGILNTEATATLMFSPAGSKLMITNPCTKLLTAYPQFCCKLAIILKGTYNNLQSWPSQEITLPQHTWDCKIIAVWNTTASFHLNNQNPGFEV